MIFIYLYHLGEYVLDLSSSAKTAEVYNAHPENEEVNGFDKQTSLKLTSKKVILWCHRVDVLLCQSLPSVVAVVSCLMFSGCL